MAQTDEVAEFMQQLFRERTESLRRALAAWRPVHAQYYAGGCLFYSRQGAVEQSEREKIVLVEGTPSPDLVRVRTETADGVSEESLIKRAMRYQVERSPKSALGWLVKQVESECPACQGTGKSHAFDPCACGGTGWVSTGTLGKFLKGRNQGGRGR